MVSLQSGIFPWFDYELSLPSTDFYIPPYVSGLSSYIHDLRLAPIIYDDPDIMTALYNASRAFAYAYYIHPKMFSKTSRYSLFVPLDTPFITQAFNSAVHPGFGAADKLGRIESRSALERITSLHMVNYRIEPEPFLKSDSTVESLGGIFFINHGMVNKEPENRIEYVMTFPHATLFFITHEIKNSY
jgi:hypothetical protein